MANRIEGVTERLLECAREEFLSRGYSDASVRTISQKAGTTPRSIYTRYGDKERLFAELVEPTAEELRGLFRTYFVRDLDKRREGQVSIFPGDGPGPGPLEAIVNYLCDRRSDCTLLICRSDGTRYAAFPDEIAAMDVQQTVLYLARTGGKEDPLGRTMPELIRALCGGFVNGFFEIVRRDMGRNKALQYARQLQKFFSSGWEELRRGW